MRKHFSTALMSDTKWRKLISALDEADIGIEEIFVKFVETADIRTIQMPRSGSLYPPWPFIDLIEFGPTELCAIEWIEIPEMTKPRIKGVPASAVKQDIEAARATIAKLGKYPIEDTDGGLKILGYIR